MDLKKLRSAVEITDREKIVERLRKRADNDLTGHRQHTLVVEPKLDGGGEHKIHKASGAGVILNAREGAPAVPDADQIKSLAERVGIKWTDDLEKNVQPYWASDARPDGHGDIVVQNWDFSEFKDFSPMPYSHEWWAPVVGRCIDWQVADRSSADYKGKALYLLGLFAPDGAWEWADTIRRLALSGFLRAGSVGFYSKRVIDIEDEEERAELGLGRWGYILDDNVLIEFSPTTIGANAGAMTILNSAKDAQLLASDDMDVIRELTRLEINSRGGTEQEWDTADKKLRAMQRTLFPDGEVRKHWAITERRKEVELGFTKSTHRVKDTDRDQDIEARVKRLEKMVEDGFAAQGIALEDMLEALETLTTRTPAAPADPDPDTTIGDSAKREIAAMSSLTLKLSALLEDAN